ncbi:hypothetical protein DSO57_1020754 [Entomophthora muscae]|uniref:Uncharacterized protein n=1 Tax=Entomophthora muscae TaxID=34485 RepID=A0ACC2S5G2_9FUNG|nr:hypothetical protein DSO57_1020754 [Entomophthora muscae]
MRIYFTKYSKLEEYERHVIQSAMAVFEFCVARLGAVGISLMPLLIVYVKEWRLVHVLLLLWGVCELWFFIYQFKVIHELEERDVGYWDSGKRAVGIEKLLEHMGDPANSAEQLLRKWHLEKVESKPCMAHFVNTLVWMFFDKHVENLTLDEALEAKVMLHKFREKLDIPSYSEAEQASRVKCIRFSVDHLEYVNKAFLFYLVRVWKNLILKVISVPRLFMLGYLWMRGFSVCADAGKKHVYWVKAGNGTEDAVVFSSGIGVGINGYLKMINDLICRYPNRTIILFETPYINLQPAASVLSKGDSLREVDDMFLDLKLDKCTWIGHSYGTVIAGWVVKNRPHYIRKLVLVDPICFRVWDVSCFKTVFYSPPDSFESNLFWIMFASDPTLARGISRHVNWFDIILFPEQIPMPTQIFLAEKDFLLDPTGLHSYLQHRIAKDNLSHIGIDTIDTCHGFFQLFPEFSERIFSAL